MEIDEANSFLYSKGSASMTYNFYTRDITCGIESPRLVGLTLADKTNSFEGPFMVGGVSI